jgi:alanyl aminopeptidase
LLSSAADDYPLAAAGNACPAWVEANDAARGYYAVDYQGPLFMSLIEGGATLRLSAAERLDVLGNAKLLVEAGKLPADRALTLAETFHDDPDRHVVEQALDLALGYRDNLVPAALLPNYQRYLERNFHARASALGWTATAGESDDSQLLRRALVRPLATVGGDAALAESGRELTDRWLAGKVEITPEMLESVLATGAYYGDLGLAERFIDKLGSTQDRQVRSKIIRAMGSFRDPAAIQALYAAVLSGKVPYIEGFRLLFAGQEFEATRPLAFKNVQAHFDELVAKRPTGGPSDFAAYLPQVGRSDCDPESRKALNDFFASRAAQFKGGPRTLAQVLEGIDLCIARKAAQERDIAEFLKQY